MNAEYNMYNLQSQTRLARRGRIQLFQLSWMSLRVRLAPNVCGSTRSSVGIMCYMRASWSQRHSMLHSMGNNRYTRVKATNGQLLGACACVSLPHHRSLHLPSWRCVARACSLSWVAVAKRATTEGGIKKSTTVE